MIDLQTPQNFFHRQTAIFRRHSLCGTDDVYANVITFKSKLVLFARHISNKAFAHFPTLREDSRNTEKRSKSLDDLRREFCRLFSDFENLTCCFSWQLPVTALNLLQAFEKSADWALLSWLWDDSELRISVLSAVISLHKGDAVETISKSLKIGNWVHETLRTWVWTDV